MREFSVGVLDGRTACSPYRDRLGGHGRPRAILSHEVAVGDLERVKPIEDEEARSAATTWRAKFRRPGGGTMRG
jgi:hypothetical protein